MYALITGASSGIGKEFARLLARKKMDLILVARRLDRLETLKEELETKYHITVILKQCDLSEEANCQKLFEDCKPYPIGVLINNAGFGKTGRFDRIPLEDELSMIQTNVIALHVLTKLFASHMNKGYILNVSSIAGHVPVPIMATYGATKAYVLSLTQSVNYEMRKLNKPIYLSALCPGPVDTEFNQVAGADFNLSSITPKQCAAEGLRGLFQKKPVIFPAKSTNILSKLSKFTPMKALLPIEYEIQTRKLDKDQYDL
ncbi:3-oxoacyl-[acyl-carrier protein] reductase [Lachnospiraceae bacterium KM106-2]|nr:3-oxoacyl-[acyl-carrier protein] reductase [Lachnospiraceae bacterium KM106-2]